MDEILEQDPIFPLLTDALRSGPGSPAWHAVLEALRARGVDAKALEAILSARETLESGKGYKSIRAGPGFTRKLMESLDSGAQSPAPSVSGPIAILSALVILVVLGVIGYWLAQSPPAASRAVDSLSSIVFTKAEIEVDFAGGDLIEAAWQRIGGVDVIDAAKGLRLTDIPASKPKSDFVGGGVVTREPIDHSEPFSLEASLRLTRNTESVLAEVFLSEFNDFSSDKGTGSREISCLVQAGHARVALPSGKVEGKSLSVPIASDSVSIRLIVDKDTAVVDVGGQRVWAGAHELGEKPLYAGVRILTRDTRTEIATFESVRVMRR